MARQLSSVGKHHLQTWKLLRSCFDFEKDVQDLRTGALKGLNFGESHKKDKKYVKAAHCLMDRYCLPGNFLIPLMVYLDNPNEDIEELLPDRNYSFTHRRTYDVEGNIDWSGMDMPSVEVQIYAQLTASEWKNLQRDFKEYSKYSFPNSGALKKSRTKGSVERDIAVMEKLQATSKGTKVEEYKGYLKKFHDQLLSEGKDPKTHKVFNRLKNKKAVFLRSKTVGKYTRDDIAKEFGTDRNHIDKIEKRTRETIEKRFKGKRMSDPDSGLTIKEYLRKQRERNKSL